MTPPLFLSLSARPPVPLHSRSWKNLTVLRRKAEVIAVLLVSWEWARKHGGRVSNKS